MNAETFSGAWYLDDAYALRMRSIITPRLMAGVDPIPTSLKRLAAAVGPKTDDSYGTRQIGDVAILEVNGTMSRFGLCDDGNEYAMQKLARLERDNTVRAVVLKVHSPGGTVDSTEAFADQIASFRKPKVGFTAYAASAGYFVLSQCDEVILEKSTSAEVGSIGVIMVHTNITKQLEKEGIEATIFRSKGSEDKARLNSIEPLTPELISEVQAELDAMLKTFKGYVRRGRMGKLTSEEGFSGKMYTAKDAIRIGLVDRQGTLADAIQAARKLADSR